MTESLLSWSCGRRHPQGRGTDQTGCGRHGAGIPSYRSRGGESVSEGNDSIGRTIYKHLMNGVSHMLPFVIGGGILIALAFLFDDYSINPANFGKNTPLAAYLKTVGEQAFGMMLPILAGFIAMSIADRPGLAVGLVAGLIARWDPPLPTRQAAM